MLNVNIGRFSSTGVSVPSTIATFVISPLASSFTVVSNVTVTIPFVSPTFSGTVTTIPFSISFATSTSVPFTLTTIVSVNSVSFSDIVSFYCYFFC